MSNRSALLLTTAILILFAVVLSLYFMITEEREITYQTGLTGEAQTNPLLATQMLYTEFGLKVKTVQVFGGEQELPPQRAALILYGDRSNIFPSRAQRILDWVAAGGYLVLAPLKPGEQPTPDWEDPLLTPFGIHTRPGENGASVALLTLQGEQPPIEVWFGDRVLMAAYDREWVYGEDPDHQRCIGIAYEKGFINVISSDELFDNRKIGSYQNATFAWEMLGFPGPEIQEVWISIGQNYPSIWRILGERAWMALATLAFFLIMLVWKLSPRLGPLAPNPSIHRRGLLDHLEAGGRFLWSHYHAETLLDSVRQSLHERLQRRRPGWLHLSESDRNRRLADLAGLSEAEVHHALERQAIRREDQFHRAVQHIEIMRRRL